MSDRLDMYECENCKRLLIDCMAKPCKEFKETQPIRPTPEQSNPTRKQ